MIIYFTTLKQALQSHFHTITIEEFFYHFYFFKITFLLSLFKPLVNVPKMYRLQVIYINQLREAVSALPAETSIPWNALLPCLLNLLMSSTAIDKNLRDFFLEDRTLLDCLFHCYQCRLTYVLQNE